MCGITGIVNLKAPDINRQTLSDMNQAIASRGPDGEGFFVDDFIGLAHRRLAIIDLKTGDQPMTSPDGRYTIVFNGEIYNFKSLRADLQKQGVVFKTESDTEVLLQSFIRKNKNCLQDLNGMFAFVIWDKFEKKLFAARDRMGKKPFYFARTQNHFVFGSELKALLKCPEVHKTLSPKALISFLTYEYVPDPLCILDGVHKLPAGHFLEMQNGHFQIQKYWDVSFLPPLEMSENEAGPELLRLLDNAVELRMISDVPVGVFLSGGLDSSSIVALMARHRDGKDIQTFSILFDEASYDESLYSETIAKKFGTTHHTETLSAGRMLDIMPSVTQYMDEPFADASILPTTLLSGFTRRHVTVALGGDGADELFCGYPTFFATKWAEAFDKSPRFLQKLAQLFAKILPRSDRNMSLDFKLKQFLLAQGYDPVLKNQIWLAGIPPKNQETLLTENFKKQEPGFDSLSAITKALTSIDARDFRQKLLYFYQKFYLCGDILTKTDRASMAHSLEVRAPYLDKNVVEFANRLPFEFKLKGVTTKYILKKIFNRQLPAMITQRPKKGFGIPITGWLKKELKPVLLETLSQSRIERDGIFHWPEVERYLNEHLSGRENHRKPLFCLLMLHFWMDSYLK